MPQFNDHAVGGLRAWIAGSSPAMTTGGGRRGIDGVSVLYRSREMEILLLSRFNTYIVLTIMETPMSFAPLAGRLAAHAAAIRPAEDARNDMAKVMALVMCAILEMFILLCEALDARAVAGQSVNRFSLDVARKSPSCAGLSRVPSIPSAHVRLVVENRAEPGHGGNTTSKKPGSHAIASSERVWRSPGPLRAIAAFSWEPRQEKAAFPPAPMHV